MNPGGEPERDDTGLPPVDIEIPDDARELDRDVQAYFRELRAERRRQRRGRWHGSLARDGIVLPLLACCLILALITGTLLTVFTATSDQNLVSPLGSGTSTNTPSSPPATTAPPASSSAPAATGTAAGPVLKRAIVPLPDVRLTVDQRPMFLRNMRWIMLVLIPPRCRCAAMVSSLTSIGLAAKSGTILVATRSTLGEAQRLRSRLSPSLAANARVTLDGQGVLQNAVPATGLTAVVMSGTTTQGRELLAYASNLPRQLTASDSQLSAALFNALRH